MKILHAIVITAAIVIGSQAFGEIKPGLEVGFTFREVMVVVEDPGDEGEKIGLTKEDVERTVKLKLLSRGLRQVEKSPSGSYLYVRVSVASNAFHLLSRLRKFSLHYGIPLDRGPGSPFIPGKQGYAVVGTHDGSKKFILDALEVTLDLFILDYLESNLKYMDTFTDKKLRGVDRAMKGALPTKTDDGFLDEWLKRYEDLIEEEEEEEEEEE